MTEAEALVVRNVLNGVEPAAAASAAGLAQDAGLGVFQEAMRRVAEYQLVMCVPFFPVMALSEARMNRYRVLEVLDEIGRWDAGDRDLAAAILKGVNVLKQGVAREEAERVLNRVLDALPHYLDIADIRAYGADRAKFVRDHRARVLAAVERFPSLREPLQYKAIVHYTGGPEGLAANLRNL